MRPKVEGSGFTADFTVQERKNLKSAHLLATLCAKLEIAGAEAVATGIEDMLGATGYEGDLESGEKETE